MRAHGAGFKIFVTPQLSLQHQLLFSQQTRQRQGVRPLKRPGGSPGLADSGRLAFRFRRAGERQPLSRKGRFPGPYSSLHVIPR
jgi:hypothetical protein